MLEPPASPTAAEEINLLRPERVIAQVMEIGDFDTVLQVRRSLGDARLARVLQRAEADWFSPRSWIYWHRKLAVTPTGPVPPLPLRRFRGG